MKIEDCTGVTHLIEHRYVVEYAPEPLAWSDDHPCSMSFSIWDEHVYTERIEEGEALSPDGPLLKGNIKWDGCSNWHEPEYRAFHLCGKKPLTGLMNAMHLCYHIAGKFMPEANE